MRSKSQKERSQMSAVKKQIIASSKSRHCCVQAARTPTPAFDLIEARAGWQAAVAEYDAASERYLALCREMESAARAAAADHSGHELGLLHQGDRLSRKSAVFQGVLVAERSTAASPMHSADAIAPHRRRLAS
jgi:hypothetical protein